jgi:hypothetical protein
VAIPALSLQTLGPLSEQKLKMGTAQQRALTPENVMLPAFRFLLIAFHGNLPA